MKAQIVNQSRDDDNINKTVTYFFGINLFPLTFRLLSVSNFTSPFYNFCSRTGNKSISVYFFR